MRVLLAQKSSYVPAHGGANKANRYILEALSARGHSCKAVVPVRAMQNHGDSTALAQHLDIRGIPFSRSGQDVKFEVGGVHVSAVGERSSLGSLRSEALCGHLRSGIIDFRPDVVLIASEDQYQFLLKTALIAAPGRIVYLARSTSMLGFGPLCFFPNPEAIILLRKTSLVVSNSQYLRSYIRRWANVESCVMDFQTYGEGPFPTIGSKATAGNIVMINPCGLKGICIFIAVAKALPDFQFSAVIGWGTTSRDIQDLGKLHNVSTTRSADDVDTMLAGAKLLLVPSLIDEAFGRIVVEAMLRGIPVLASDVGGLPESTLGEGTLLSVVPITKLQQRFDENYIPKAEIAAQNVQPWIERVRELMTNPSVYDQLSDRCSRAAMIYVSALRFDAFELMLSTLGTSGAENMPSTSRASSAHLVS